jgi:hypothetical protein
MVLLIPVSSGLRMMMKPQEKNIFSRSLKEWRSIQGNHILDAVI